MRHVTVLYAEDDENDMFFMERAFSKLGAREDLRVVGDGQQVLNYLLGTGEFADREQFPLPALLLLDVKMPQMSGLEALRWIRDQPEFDEMTIVMLTSSTQESDIEFCAAHGANAYMVKPSRSDQLSELMPKVLAAAAESQDGKPMMIPGNLLEG